MDKRVTEQRRAELRLQIEFCSVEWAREVIGELLDELDELEEEAASRWLDSKDA
jgi:hypothetical protein